MKIKCINSISNINLLRIVINGSIDELSVSVQVFLVVLAVVHAIHHVERVVSPEKVA